MVNFCLSCKATLLSIFLFIFISTLLHAYLEQMSSVPVRDDGQECGEVQADHFGACTCFTVSLVLSLLLRE